ncbi:hypothetical protein BH09CHL1_BH09CHL1_12770 [soil metagenome]
MIGYRLDALDGIEDEVERILPGAFEIDQADANGVRREPDGTPELAIEAPRIEQFCGDGSQHDLALAFDDRFDSQNFAAQSQLDQRE